MNLHCPDTLIRKGKNILSCYHSAGFGHSDFNFGDHAGNSMWKKSTDYRKNKTTTSRENQF